MLVVLRGEGRLAVGEGAEKEVGGVRLGGGRVGGWGGGQREGVPYGMSLSRR